MSLAKKVFIVIPHWNHREVLKDCLFSLQKIKYPNYKIVVSDNGSEDGSPDFIQKNFPEFFLLENKKNLGFAGGCNQGIKWSLKQGADYILLLNNDTIVAPDFLDKLVEAAEADKNVGIVGSKIYYYDQPKKIWFAGGDFIKWRASGKHRFWQKKG
ncbi:glycosyltransferase family 2 protein [Patescibacteria group bacterium]|nr:glycosyltransferase family 2 protein [Patescibacteria group bacterium]